MLGRRLSQERYINPLTDFGFKRLFGSEPNKALLMDFLNAILPAHHTISDLSYRNNENIGNTAIDRKAIFDIYCKTIVRTELRERAESPGLSFAKFMQQRGESRILPLTIKNCPDYW